MASSANGTGAGVAMGASAIFAGLITAVIATAFGISFAAIVYTGPLSEYLSQGIALTLLGSGLMAGVAPFLLSYRGTVVHVQDVTAILVAIAAGSIAGSGAVAAGAVFPTVAMLIVAITLFTGAVLWLSGHFRLGFIARFAPYPVLGGFLAATGYLLTLGAFGMMLRTPIDIYSLHLLLDADALYRWLPWTVVAAVIVGLTRIADTGVVLPLGLAVAGLGFYGILAILGISIEEAEAAGLLLGPFEGDAFLVTLTPEMFAAADWGAIALQAPTFVAVAAMALLGTLLNASGIELSTRRDLDFEADLKGAGIANLLGGAGGSLVGYHTIGETVFLNRTGLITPLSGLLIAAVHFTVILFGAHLISALPMGLIGAVVAFLGIDFLVTWLWTERRRLPGVDFAIILLILIVAATIGFLQALTVGLLASALLFILSYARADVVRLTTSLETRRSSVERGAAEQEVLGRDGHRARIFELTGYLFFGTANSLVDRVKRVLAHDGVTDVVVDFARVPGMDASAAFALGKLGETCTRHSVTLHVSGMRPQVGDRFATVAAGGEVIVHKSLDDALLAIENTLLEGMTESDPVADFPGRLKTDHPDVDLSGIVAEMTLSPGDLLIEQGSASTALFALLSGELRAEVKLPDGGSLTVARFRPGALLGEIAFYAESERTASVLAETPSVVARIDLDAIPDTPEGRALAADIHRHAAGYLARRLMRMTALARDAGH